MRITISTLLGFAAVAAAAPAVAADIVYAPFSYAYAGAFSSGEVSNIAITNGVVGNSGGGSTGTLATSTSADTYINSASVSTDLGNSSVAHADLHAGTVKAIVTNGPNNPPRGFAEARIKDTLFFTNSSNETLFLPFQFSFDGRLTDPNDFGATATATFAISGALTACADGSYGGCYGDHSVFLQTGGNVNQTTIIGYAANGRYNGVQQGGAFFFNAPDNVDLANYSVFKDWASGDGYYNTVVSSVLALQPGNTRLGLDLRLSIDSWLVRNSVADFGNTTRFSLGAMPNGLSFTSASGVFLAGTAVGGVPEPASWALLILGFGAIGVRLRRRHPAPAA